MLTQNTKMKKSGIWGFGITPGMTCVNCKIKCYAVRGAYNIFQKTCISNWDRNLNYTQAKGFIAEMYVEILKKKAKYVRIHTEGDFYSQEYLNKWIRLAKLLPDVVFYAYTKALHLDWSELPSNFKRIQSIGGEHDGLINYSLPHAKVFDSVEDLNNAGYLNASEDDLIAANFSSTNIGLVFH